MRTPIAAHAPAVYADDEPVGFVRISAGTTVDDPEFVAPLLLHTEHRL